MQNYINSVTSTNGDAVAGATVTVLKSDGTVPTLYAANGSSAYPSNVLTADSRGQYSFYAANGTYTITVSSLNFAGQTQSGIVLYDPIDAGIQNARLFGAVGNGVADDTAALQLALNRAGSIYIPAGTYLVTSALVVRSNTTIYGDGWSSIVKTVSMSSGGTGIGQRIFAVEGVTNVVIRDLQVDNSGITVFLAGGRAINCSSSSNYVIENVYGRVNGSLVASINCTNYRISNNEIYIASTDAAAHGNGVIDNWGGSNGFTIQGNHVLGNAIGQYGILVTGLATDGVTATPCFRFTISGNRIENCTQVGIWTQGRAGLVYEFAIHGNVIDTATFFGIELSDCYDFTVTGNVVKSTGSNNLRCCNETPGTWANPNYAARQGAITGNVFEGSNTSVSANNDTGSAVSITDTSQAIEFVANVIRGTQHRYAVFLGTNSTGVDVKGEQMQAGTVGTLLNQATAANTNTPPGGNLYQPTLTAVANVSASTPYTTTTYERSGNTVTVYGRIDVTPTAAASTTTQIGISLPIASVITNVYDIAGHASTSFATTAAIYGDVANGRAQLQFPAPNTSANVFYFSFKYIVR